MWYSAPYPRAEAPAYTGKMPRPLYPPDAAAQGKKPSVDGPDVVAVKRALKRGQRWAINESMESLDDAYSNRFAHGDGTGNVGGSGVAGFQRQQHLDVTGWIGQKTFDDLNWALVPTGPNVGQPLFDDYAIALLQDAWNRFKGKEPAPPPEPAPPKPPPSSKPTFKEALTAFCEMAISEPWNYSQNRAIDVSIDPNGPNNSDCSGSTIQAFHYANRQSGDNVPDPSKYNYAGWGNTWDDEDGHPKVTNGSYKVGDLAHYDGHVTVCYHPGNSDTADWFSFGSEPPSKRKLYYRSDFKFVVRPPMSPSPDTYSTTFERLTAWIQFWRVQRYVLFWKNGRRRGDPPTD
jgi:hypothetical protein